MDNSTGILIKGLSKRYGKSDKKALDNLSLEVKRGEVYGFLGPNGAGKSTTIRLLMNFIQPTGGQASILGYDIVSQSTDLKRHIGYLSGDFEIYPKMNGKQYLTYMDELQEENSLSYARKLAKNLKAQLDKPVGELSRGNRQKIALIQALMHQPEVLILDEPSSGFDPLVQETFYELVKEAKQRESVVFISSHILGEVQKVCDRVGIIRDGKLITERSIAEMASEAAQTFDINFASLAPVSELRKIKGVKIVDHTNNQVTIHVHGHLSPLFALLAKHEVIKIDARNLDLEEVFIRFYQGKDSSK